MTREEELEELQFLLQTGNMRQLLHGYHQCQVRKRKEKLYVTTVWAPSCILLSLYAARKGSSFPSCCCCISKQREVCWPSAWNQPLRSVWFFWFCLVLVLYISPKQYKAAVLPAGGGKQTNKQNKTTVQLCSVFTHSSNNSK